MVSITIVLIAKVPTPGRVKTRLQPVLSPEQASQIHAVFLTHVASRLRKIASGNFLIAYDPPDARSTMASLVQADEYEPQTAGDLGARIASIASGQAHKSRSVLFFGVDSPDVPMAYVRAALEALDLADVVIGPSEDGGYWCLGLSPKVDAARLLCDIGWSSGQECVQTIARAEQLGYRVTCVAGWDDVDHPRDLSKLLERLRRSVDSSSINPEAIDRDAIDLLARLDFLKDLTL